MWPAAWPNLMCGTNPGLRPIRTSSRATWCKVEWSVRSGASPPMTSGNSGHLARYQYGDRRCRPVPRLSGRRRTDHHVPGQQPPTLRSHHGINAARPPARQGSCHGNIQPVQQFSGDDPSASALPGHQPQNSGCGYAIDNIPDVVSLGGWSPGNTSLDTWTRAMAACGLARLRGTRFVVSSPMSAAT